jgi:hypothetical protein
LRISQVSALLDRERTQNFGISEVTPYHQGMESLHGWEDFYVIVGSSARDAGAGKKKGH